MISHNEQNNNNQPKSKAVWYIIAAAVLLTLINLLVYQCNRTEQPTETITTDTITMTDTIMETDTFCFYQPVPKLEIINHWDTLYTPKDTVPIPYKRVEYLDSVVKGNGARVLYYASISGYEPSLDTLTFDVTYPEITNTEYVTTTIEKVIEKKNSRFSIGPSVGFGYGIFSKQPDLYAGLSLTYRF